MASIKLTVSLKIPDTTAITAFHTLERMGYKELMKLAREDYYEFEIAGDAEKFSREIVKVDILVNANKHDSAVSERIEPREGYTDVLVTNADENNEGLMSTLKGMGFGGIRSVRKGTLWKMMIESDDKLAAAERITKDLLCNEHYQTYSVL